MSSRNYRTALPIVLLLLVASMSLVVPATAQQLQAPRDQASSQSPARQLNRSIRPLDPNSDGRSADPQTSHRLIVELNSAPLAVWAQQSGRVTTDKSRPDVSSPAAQSYVATLRNEQAAFVQAMRAALPTASVSTFENENGVREAASYQIVFNGMSVDPGRTNRDQARQALLRLPNVKNVYLDFAHATTLYTSTTLINAPALWTSSAVGGRAKGGEGIKLA